MQHAQLTLAAIHDLALTDNELGSMIQYLQHFVPVGHIGGFDQGGEPFPVHATGFDIESVTFQRNPLFQVRPDSRGTAFRQAPVDFRGTLRGSPGNDANRSNLEGGITPKRGQTAGERVQAGAVVPEQGIQTRVTLAEINLDATVSRGIDSRAIDGPGANSKKNGKKSNLFLMQLKILQSPGIT